MTQTPNRQKWAPTGELKKNVTALLFKSSTSLQLKRNWPFKKLQSCTVE